MKKLLLAVSVASAALLSGCQSDASTASRNLSTASDMFEVDRRIVFYNGINGEYMMTLEGKCKIKPEATKLSVTCKTAPGEYKKHYLGLSDNVTYFVEQLEGVGVSVYHNRIILKPQSIVPNIDINGSTSDFAESMTK